MGMFTLDIINEIYFGDKSENIQKMQKMLSKIRRSAITHKNEFIKRANTNPDILKFNRLAEDTFGFKVFSLYIQYDIQKNCYTIPISCNLAVYDPRKYIKSSNKGFKYDKSANYCTVVVITSAILLDEDFSDREIFSLILHEIGHNFSSNFTKNPILFNTCKKSIALVSIIEGMIFKLKFDFNVEFKDLFAMVSILPFKFTSKMFEKFTKELNGKFPALTHYADTIGYIKRMSFYYFSAGLGILNIIKNPINSFIMNIKALINPINIANVILTYDDEKRSDDFATMYGYGAEISSSLLKLDFNSSQYFSQTLIGLINFPLWIIGNGLSTHPSTSTRVQNALNYLKNEVSKENIDPKMKKEMEDQIKSIEKDINKYLSSSKIISYNADQELRRNYEKFIYNMFGGDIREKISDNQQTYDNIDKIYKSKLESVNFI